MSLHFADKKAGQCLSDKLVYDKIVKPY